MFSNLLCAISFLLFLKFQFHNSIFYYNYPYVIVFLIYIRTHEFVIQMSYDMKFNLSS